MKRSTLGLFFVVLHLFSVPTYSFRRGKTFFSPRSQSVNAARELVGWYMGINRHDVGDDYGSLSATFEYTHTFHPKNIARYFFGTDFLTFTGSRVANRDPFDILADYFGLPTDYRSTVRVLPYAQNILFDVDWFCGLDAWCKGVYLRAHAPVVHALWNLNLDECIECCGMNNYPAGYMANKLIERREMAGCVTHALTGNVAFGDYQKLKFGKVDCSQKTFGLSEIQIAFGWNMIGADDYHFGMNVRTSVPTGTRPNGEYLFEPIIGNGHHWELGFGLSGHKISYYCDDEWMVGLYGDANLTHLFASEQRRSFDFVQNGPGSRYILIQEIGTPIAQGLTVNEMVAEQQYHGKIMPAINQTTLDCDVRIDIQFDLVLMLTWRYKNIDFDIGYNFWARTAEHLNCREKFPENCFALKGDAQVYGFIENTTSFVGLNATQSLARIQKGQGEGNANKTFTNANADNPADAQFKGDTLTQSYSPKGIVKTGLEPADITDVKGSRQAVLLRDCDIDNFSALSGAAFTHKIFMHLGYTFVERVRVEPYLGLGGEIEVDASDRHSKDVFSQWGVWLKGGVSY